MSMRHSGRPEHADGRGVRRLKVPVSERLMWAYNEMKRNPDMSLQGPDGIHQRMKQKFGKSAYNDELVKLKQQVLAERAGTDAARVSVDQTPAREAAPHVVVPKTPPPTAPPTPPSASKPPTPPPSPPPSPPPPKAAEPDESQPSTYARAGTGLKTSDTEERLRFARDVMNREPGIGYNDLRARIKAQFGRGLATHLITQLRGRAKRAAKVPPKGRGNPTWVKGMSPANPTGYNTPKALDPGLSEQESRDLKAALGMVLEVCPRIRKLVLTVKDGKPEVGLELETVVVRPAKLDW